jgi:hypothetical protein
VLDELLPRRSQSCKAADADRQATWRPGVDERDDPNRGGALVPAGCRCRKHSHADFAPDHLANGVEDGQADTQFQTTACAECVVFDRVLEGITGSEANMVKGKGIAKCDRPLMAHHMIAGCNEHKPIFGKGKRLKFFSGIDLVPDDTDLGKILGDGAHNLAAGTLLQIDVDLGME